MSMCLLKEIVQFQWDSKGKIFPCREGNNQHAALCLPGQSCSSIEKLPQSKKKWPYG